MKVAVLFAGLTALTIASACAGPPSAIAELIAFQTTDQELHSTIYFADPSGAYTTASGEAQVIVSCGRCYTVETGSVLLRRDEAIEPHRFTARDIERTGRHLVYYTFEPVDLSSRDAFAQLSEGDSLEVCVTFSPARGPPIRGCEDMYWSTRHRRT